MFDGLNSGIGKDGVATGDLNVVDGAGAADDDIQANGPSDEGALEVRRVLGFDLSDELPRSFCLFRLLRVGGNSRHQKTR